MNNSWLQKAVILFLAIMTVFAFAPFVFSPPSSPQQQRGQEATPSPSADTTTQTNTTSSDPSTGSDTSTNSDTSDVEDIPAGIKAPSS